MPRSITPNPSSAPLPLRFVASRLFAAALLAPAAASAATPSRSDTSCIEHYELAQEQRHEGSLLAARAQFFACATSSCQSFIEEDCLRWLNDLEREIPTVILEARSGGNTLSGVRVSEGGDVLTDALAGGPIELNPGAHWLRFEAPGRPPHVEPVVLMREEKNRRVVVELPPAEARSSTPGRASGVTIPPATWALGALGVAGLTGFALFGSAGLSEESRLERTCAPDCTTKELDSVERKYTLADISLGVGLASLAVGAVMLVGGGDGPRAAARPSALRVQASPTGGTLTWRNTF